MKTLRGLTWIELLVVIVIVVVPLIIMWPVFGRERPSHAGAHCMSQIRQLATAIQMYAQDNGKQYPCTNWVNNIASYIGGSEKMFYCQKDLTDENHLVSYGYSNLLVLPNGEGISEDDVLSPSEVGAVCDATPSTIFPKGGLIGCQSVPGMQQPASRHNKGTMVGYCDGHAMYNPGDFDPREMANGVTRAFYQVASLGLVNNPTAGLTAGQTGGQAKITIGGEPVVQPFLLAAAKLHGKYTTKGFLGQYAVQGRPRDYAWGVADGRTPAGHAIPVARDIVLVVVAKGSKIPTLGKLTNYAYVKEHAGMRSLFAGSGYVANSVQVYTLPPTSGTRRFFSRAYGITMGTQAIEVANDFEIVDKVSNDPYGIGYCSSAVFDPERLTEVALRDGAGAVWCFPQANPKHRWELPNTPPAHPLLRTLYVTFGGTAWSTTSRSFATDHFTNSAATLQALQDGPLFQCGYWKP